MTPTQKETHSINVPTNDLREKYVTALTDKVSYKFVDGTESHPFGIIFETQADRKIAINLITDKFA